MSYYKLGADIGTSGALALLTEDNKLLAVVDMPTMAATKNRKQVNGAELHKILLKWEKSYWPIMAYVEYQSAMPGQGVSGVMSLGLSFGIVQGVLVAHDIPVVFIRPVVWKRLAGLPKRAEGESQAAYKEHSRVLAQKLYPQAELGYKKDHGKSEALLIARFCG